MPKMTEHPSAEATKCLFLGDSGSGKTGALAALVKAGYSLRIADFDAGLDILRDLLTPEELATVYFQTFTDSLKTVNGRLIPSGVPKGFSNFLKALDKWPDDDLGPVSSWTPNDVLVVDSMTFMGSAALRYVLALNNRSGQQPYQSDWGEAMRYVENVLEKLYSAEIKCNIVVTSHITFIEQEGQAIRGLPTALGSKLPPKVPRYFNTVVMAQSKGFGSGARHTIHTQPKQGVELKTAAPSRVKAEYPIRTGLADLFRDLQGA